MSYRILSLDGGGAWALIEARALAEIHGAEKTGHEVLEAFDMAAANSGGAIVLGGLVANATLGEILGYFENEQTRRSIFKPVFWSWLTSRIKVGPRYSAKAKLPALRALYPERGDWALPKAARGVGREGSEHAIHLLFTAFDYDRNRARFFRSVQVGPPPGVALRQDLGPVWGDGAPSDVTLAEAIHASTNAPINYFNAPARFPDQPRRYWDGAIAGCNNPVLAAVTEALALGVNPKDIAVLSIGTGTVALPWPTPADAGSPYVQTPTHQCFVNDVRKIGLAILDDPPDIASYLAHVMTGAGAGVAEPADSRVVRMSPAISPTRGPDGRWTAPAGMGPKAFRFLQTMDMDAVAPNQVAAITAYAKAWIAGDAANQPVRMDADTLHLEIGQPTFAAALAAWNSIKSAPGAGCSSTGS